MTSLETILITLGILFKIKDSIELIRLRKSNLSITESYVLASSRNDHAIEILMQRDFEIKKLKQEIQKLQKNGKATN